MGLPRMYRVIQDAQGNAIPEVLCSVLNEGTGVLAQLYQDDAGTIPLANPMTSSATYGSIGFYVAPGHYDLTFSKPGFVFEPQLDFQVPNDTVTLGSMAYQSSGSVAITGGTIIGLSQLETVAIGIGEPAQPASFRLLAAAGPSIFRGPLGVNNVNPMTALDVNGGARIANLGLGTMPNVAYSLVAAYTSLFQGPLGVNNLPPLYPLDVNGQSRFLGAMGIERLPDPEYSLSTAHGIYCGETLTVAGHLAMSTAGLTGNLYVGGTLTVAGTATLQGTASVTSNFSCGGSIATQYLQTSLETGLQRAVVAGWALSVGGSIQSNNTIANKLGAGPWGESSSRHLKRDIADIPDPLGLLLAQRGRRYQWEEPEHAAALPGPQHGFVYDEVTIEQWKDTGPNGEEILTLRGTEALFLEALRQVVTRLETVEHLCTQT